MKPYRYITAALLLASTSLGAAAATLTPEQAQYVRMHQTTTAFINTIPYSDVNLEQPRALLNLSEQFALREDFAQAGRHARAAYELLRNSIMASVGRNPSASRVAGH